MRKRSRDAIQMISRDVDASVVLVEDPLIRRFVRLVLARRKRTVVDANAADAIRLVKSGNSKVCLLITNRPREFESFAEELPLLYVSSRPEPEWATRFRACRTLNKPFGPSELAAAVSELIGPVVS
jgi:hypothetical protein